MLQNKRRIVSLILMLTLLVASIAVIGISASAAETSTGTWTLVTDASTLKAGDQIVIASNAKDVVASKTIKSSYMTNVTATFSTDKSTITSLPSDAAVLTLGGSADAWTLANSDGQLLGATAVKKVAWDSGTTTWSITISDNNATIQNGTETYGRFLYNVNSPRFTTYTSNTSASMLLPQIYKFVESTGGSGSGEESDCEHANTTTTTVDATCTENGSTTVVCDDCGETVSTATIDALGHTGGTATCKVLAKCETCGEEYGDYAAHNLVNGVCTVCGVVRRFTLVTNVADLAAGDQIVIVASEYDYALSTEQKSNNRGQAVFVKSDNTVTLGEDVQVLTLETGTIDGTFAFNTGSGYLYAASSSSNYLRTETTLSDNSSWEITIADGVTTIIAQGGNTRNVLQYNQSSSLFACYGSASQKAVSIYKCSDELGDDELLAQNNETGAYAIIENTYFTFLGVGVRYKNADGTTPEKVALRFGYDFSSEVTSWGWNYKLGSKGVAEKVGEYKTAEGITNLVFTNIVPVNYEFDIQTQLWFTVEIDGVSYTVYDNWQVDTAYDVLTRTAASSDTDAAAYAQSMLDAYTK